MKFKTFYDNVVERLETQVNEWLRLPENENICITSVTQSEIVMPEGDTAWITLCVFYEPPRFKVAKRSRDR